MRTLAHHTPSQFPVADFNDHNIVYYNAQGSWVKVHATTMLILSLASALALASTFALTHALYCHQSRLWRYHLPWARTWLTGQGACTPIVVGTLAAATPRISHNNDSVGIRRA
jgi:hypothetical protein